MFASPISARQVPAMHPPLHRPHPKCHEVVKILVACHEDNPYAKFFGACNDAKAAIDKCFAREKEDNRSKNLAKARRFDAEFQLELDERKKDLEAEQQGR